MGFAGDDTRESGAARSGYRCIRSGGWLRTVGNELAARARCSTQERVSPRLRVVIESTKSFIARAEKRRSSIDDQIAELIKQKTSVEKELSDADVRLKAMELEAADLLNCKPLPVLSSSVDALIQGCTSLLQAIESTAALRSGASTTLPPTVLDAMRSVHASVAQMRPLPPPTLDTPLEAVPAVTIIDDDLLMEEMDEADLSDEALLEIVKRLRAKRLRTN